MKLVRAKDVLLIRMSSCNDKLYASLNRCHTTTSLINTIYILSYTLEETPELFFLKRRCFINSWNQFNIGL